MPATKKKPTTKTKAKPKTRPKAKAKAKATAAPGAARKARHPAWQGMISFGLINVPVMLYGVTLNHRIAFHQLDKDDHARIKQKRVSASTGKEVDYEDIVKGFEISPDNYVVIEPDELDDLDPERSSAIEAPEAFIDAAEIDPLYYDASYFAIPGKNAAKPYALLRDAMAAEGRAAVARLVMHQKEHLVALWPREEMLVVSTLHFYDEVTDPDELPGPSGPSSGAKPAELKAARQLVKALSGDFDIRDYRDEYREAVLALIEKKAKGSKISKPKKAAARKPVPDLMAALEKSLAGVSGLSSRRPKSRKRGSSGPHKAKAD